MDKRELGAIRRQYLDAYRELLTRTKQNADAPTERHRYDQPAGGGWRRLNHKRKHDRAA